MTIRLKGLMVAFGKDVREDDAEALIAAIRQLRGVLDVTPIEATGEDWIVRSRVHREFVDSIYVAIEKASKGTPK